MGPGWHQTGGVLNEVTVGDLNNDGCLDVIRGSCRSGLEARLRPHGPRAVPTHAAAPGPDFLTLEAPGSSKRAGKKPHLLDEGDTFNLETGARKTRPRLAEIAHSLLPTRHRLPNARETHRRECVYKISHKTSRGAIPGTLAPSRTSRAFRYGRPPFKGRLQAKFWASPGYEMRSS